MDKNPTNGPIIVNCEGFKTIPELSSAMVDELYAQEAEFLKFKMIDCGTIPLDDNMTFFMFSKDRIDLCPTIWDPSNASGKDVTPFYIRFGIHKDCATVTITVYDRGGENSEPSYTISLPIEPFLTPVGLKATWQRYPIPVWERRSNRDMSHISYPFWIHVGNMIKLLYTKL